MILDDVLTDLNKKYIFKLLAFFALSLPTFQFSSQMQNVLLSIITPNFTCQHNLTGDKFTISKDQCSIGLNGSIIKCTRWNFSLLPVGKTMVSDYGLVCDYKNLGDIILVTWYLTAISGPIMGWFADRFGRKKMVIFNLCLETVATISLAYTPNVATNIICRILMGISSNGLYTCYVWLVEIVNNEFREFVGSFFWFYGCIAYIVFPLTAYMCKDWRKTQLFSLIPSLLYMAILFVPESPRWSSIMNRKQELMQSLKTMAKVNKIDFNLVPEDIYVEKTIKEHNVLIALKEPTFTFRTSVSFLCVFTINLLYSSIVINLNILSDNIYLSMFFLGLMEFPGLFLSYISLRYFKRKDSFVFIGGVGATFILISIFFSTINSWQSMVRIILGCIGKVAITSCNQSIMVYINELSPTSHRSFSFAYVQIANLVSFTAAVYINKLHSIYYFLPMLIYFILMAVTSLVMYVTLPETKDLPIPETVADQKMLKVWKEESFLTYMYNKTNLLRSNSINSKESDYNLANEESRLINRKDH